MKLGSEFVPNGELVRIVSPPSESIEYPATLFEPSFATNKYLPELSTRSATGLANVSPIGEPESSVSDPSELIANSEMELSGAELAT